MPGTKTTYREFTGEDAPLDDCDAEQLLKLKIAAIGCRFDSILTLLFLRKRMTTAGKINGSLMGSNARPFRSKNETGPRRCQCLYTGSQP